MITIHPSVSVSGFALLAVRASAQLLINGTSCRPDAAKCCPFIHQAAAPRDGTTASQTTWLCFCQSAILDSLDSSASGICDASCRVLNGNEHLNTWYTSNCGTLNGDSAHPGLEDEDEEVELRRRQTSSEPSTTVVLTNGITTYTALTATNSTTQTVFSNATGDTPSATITWPGVPEILTTDTFNATTALTTIFTPSSLCSAGPWISTASTQGVITCTQQIASSELCFPEAFVTLQDGGGIYSPGVCPSGYHPDRSWVLEDSDAITSICCPLGMSYLQLASSCESFVSTVAAVVINDQTTQYTDPFTVFAPTIAVAWASSDLPSFTPASAPVIEARLASSTATSTSSTLTTSSILSASVPASTPTTVSASNAGLSTGSKAGIGIGVALAVLLIVTVGAWLLWRRRRRSSGNSEEQYVAPKAELPGKDAEKKFAELDPNGNISEVTGAGHRAELNPDVRHELDSGWQGHEASGDTPQEPKSQILKDSSAVAVEAR